MSHTNMAMAKAASRVLSKLEEQPTRIETITRERAIELFKQRKPNYKGHHGYRQCMNSAIEWETYDGVAVRVYRGTYSIMSYHAK